MLVRADRSAQQHTGQQGRGGGVLRRPPVHDQSMVAHRHGRRRCAHAAAMLSGYDPLGGYHP